MANKTGWAGGRLFSGFGWNAGFGAELGTLVNGNAVMSSVTIANNTGLDQLIDMSLIAVIASNAPAAGAGVTVWLAPLAADGSTYGDGRITTTSGTYLPPWSGLTFLPIGVGSGITSLVATVLGIPIPPGSFKLIAQNLVGFTFSSAQIYVRSYDQDLNAA